MLTPHQRRAIYVTSTRAYLRSLSLPQLTLMLSNLEASGLTVGVDELRVELKRAMMRDSDFLRRKAA